MRWGARVNVPPPVVVNDLSDSRGFFVDAQDRSSSSSVSTPALGHVRRACDACGKPWDGEHARCSDVTCTSTIVTETYIEAVPFGARLMEKLAPKPKAPRADAAQTSALRGFRRSVERFSGELAQLDELLRRAVRDGGVEELQPAQAILNLAVSTIGDAPPERIAGLNLALSALGDALTGAIRNIEDTK